MGSAAESVIPERPRRSHFAFLGLVNLWELLTGLFVLVVGVFGGHFDAAVSKYSDRMVHTTIVYELAFACPGVCALMATQVGDHGPLKNKVAQSIVSVLALALGAVFYVLALEKYLGEETAKIMLPQSAWVFVGRFYPRAGISILDPRNLFRGYATCAASILWLVAVVMGRFGIQKLCGVFDAPTPDWVIAIQWGFYYITLAFMLPLIDRYLRST
jgi:hypothetical protein